MNAHSSSMAQIPHTTVWILNLG